MPTLFPASQIQPTGFRNLEANRQGALSLVEGLAAIDARQRENASVRQLSELMDILALPEEQQAGRLSKLLEPKPSRGGFAGFFDRFNPQAPHRGRTAVTDALTQGATNRLTQDPQIRRSRSLTNQARQFDLDRAQEDQAYFESLPPEQQEQVRRQRQGLEAKPGWENETLNLMRQGQALLGELRGMEQKDLTGNITYTDPQRAAILQKRLAQINDRLTGFGAEPPQDSTGLAPVTPDAETVRRDWELLNRADTRAATDTSRGPAGGFPGATGTGDIPDLATSAGRAQGDVGVNDAFAQARNQVHQLRRQGATPDQIKTQINADNLTPQQQQALLKLINVGG